MHTDTVGKVAKADPLIVTIGNRWMENLRGNVINRRYYTSGIMRLCARFLICLRKQAVPHSDPNCKDVENSLTDYLRPQHFDLCVKAAFECSSQDVDDLDDLKTPSNAIKLGYELKRLVGAKSGYAIRSRDQQTKSECTDFLELMRNEWGVRVSKLARITLAERKFNEKKSLPEPQDVKKLSEYIASELKTLDIKVISYATYHRACTLVEAKLVAYNRRRPGEVQAIKLASYFKRKVGTEEIDDEMTRELTDWEKHLLLSQQVLEVRGKTGRGVPVILPSEVQRMLEFISSPETRTHVGLDPENPFLFAGRGLGVIRAYDSLSTVAQEADLKVPGKLTSTNLRKYMATMTQVINMNRAQLDWVCDHMGHTVDVHRIHYRSRSDILERIEVSKLLLLQDKGRTKEFVGKTLADIQLPDIVFDQALDIEPRPSVPEEALVDPPVQPAIMEHEPLDIYDRITSDEQESDEEVAAVKKRKKTKTVCNRQVWLETEENELRKLFRSSFERMALPKPKDVVAKIDESKAKGGLIWKRPKDNIRKKLWNMIQKSKQG